MVHGDWPETILLWSKSNQGHQSNLSGMQALRFEDWLICVLTSTSDEFLFVFTLYLNHCQCGRSVEILCRSFVLVPIFSISPCCAWQVLSGCFGSAVDPSAVSLIRWSITSVYLRIYKALMCNAHESVCFPLPTRNVRLSSSSGFLQLLVSSSRAEWDCPCFSIDPTYHFPPVSAIGPIIMTLISGPSAFYNEVIPPTGPPPENMDPRSVMAIWQLTISTLILRDVPNGSRIRI